mmetsp:Transcript_106935/g.201474  ORF Transcript_106935/g.201474 Transcript_106935/m.201474 type:complete len:540 (-) Transcript_106935:57-1676(-)
MAAVAAPNQPMEASKTTDRAAAADILFKTPENRLKWFQKVLPYLRSGKISNTVVFDALTHQNFATGLPLMIGRQLREMAMSNLHLFTQKQQSFLKSPANKLNDYAGDNINPAEQWLASGKDMMAGAAAIAAAFPSLAKAVAESSGITKPDAQPALPPPPGGQPPRMSEAETTFHQQVQSMQKEREEERREEKKRDSGAAAAVAANFLTKIRSNAAVNAASAEAAAVQKPAKAKDISKMTDAELEAKLKRLKDPTAVLDDEYDPEAPADEKSAHVASEDPMDLSKLSKEDLLKELEALRGDGDGNKDDLTDAFDISRGAFIPGRQYKPACTYLPGQSPSPERKPRAVAEEVEGRPEDPDKELKEKAMALALVAPRQEPPSSREKKRRSRSRKRRRKSSSSSDSSPKQRKAKRGGWDSNVPDLEALRAAQLAARMRVEAAVSGGAAGGASIGSPGLIGPMNQPTLPSTVTFAGGGRNTQQGGADHNTLRAAQMKAATRLVYFPAGDSAPFRDGDWMCPLCNAHNYRTKEKCFRCSVGTRPI